ncbi:MAG: hypothetical protein L0Z55_04760, partial [Planctomycetes bacterium]|nr:hypothetical protein [Planctomycetota bacterium]
MRTFSAKQGKPSSCGPAEIGNVKIVVPVIVAALIFLAAMFLMRDSGSRDRAGGGGGDSPAAESEGSPLAGDAESSAETEAPDAAPVAAALPPGGGLVCDGLVLHATTLEPLADVEVAHFTSASPGFGDAGAEAPVAVARTAADGTYQLPAAQNPSGTSSYSFSKEGFVEQRIWHWGAQSGFDIQTVLLSPGIKVTGEVVTAEGKPVSVGRVFGCDRLQLQMYGDISGSASDAGAAYVDVMGWQPTTATVDAAGRFTIYLRSGKAAVQAAIPGFAPAYSEMFELSPNSARHVRIAVSPGKT